MKAGKVLHKIFNLFRAPEYWKELKWKIDMKFAKHYKKHEKVFFSLLRHYSYCS